MIHLGELLLVLGTLVFVWLGFTLGEQIGLASLSLSLLSWGAMILSSVAKTKGGDE